MRIAVMPGDGIGPEITAANVHAIDALLDDPARRTRDLGGTLGTRAFTEALFRELDCCVGQAA